MMKRPVKSYSIEEATKALEYYCTYQDRCHKEVREKLRSMRMIPMAIDQIMVHLIEEGYLDETRFACAFARGKFNQKSWGRLRIERELKQREISSYNIGKALNSIDEEEYLDCFKILSEKRWSDLSREKNVLIKKKKFADYLIYRGWERELIYEKLREFH